MWKKRRSKVVCIDSNYIHTYRVRFILFSMINGIEYTKEPKPWDIIEIPISSQNVDELIFTYKESTINFTDKYNDIIMNQIYYNHRP